MKMNSPIKKKDGDETKVESVDDHKNLKTKNIEKAVIISSIFTAPFVDNSSLL